MARRRKGEAIHGWLVVDKPAGMTSTQVVSKARWASRARKAGHAGTLDPLATGVLAIALGEATKTVSLVQEGLKAYRFTIRLGQATATDDAEGEVIAQSAARPGDAEIAAALAAYRGWIEQVPPQVSAVKVEGERAYALARDGVEMDLAPRPLWVERLELVARPDRDHAVLEMVCGKGGYVRAIARDLGRDLGCHAHVTALRRTRAGPFTLDPAIGVETLDEIRQEGVANHLLPVATGLDDIPALAVPTAVAARLRQGQAVPVHRPDLDEGSVAWASLEGVPVALGTVGAGRFRPSRVINLDG